MSCALIWFLSWFLALLGLRLSFTFDAIMLIAKAFASSLLLPRVLMRRSHYAVGISIRYALRTSSVLVRSRSLEMFLFGRE